jgi:D-3-phosphoglycerate dehydrogenase / 2-oxoglutarate reductase
MLKSILVTDKVHELLINGLEKSGFKVIYNPKMPYEEVKSHAINFNGLIINSKVICDEDFLLNNQHLDFIGRLGSGLDIIDLPKAKELGIKIINSPEGNANAVAEHAMGLILGLINNMHKANAEVKVFNWNREPNRGIELEGRTIGIIGFGHTGSQVARKLKTWDMNILAYDKYRNHLGEEFDYVKAVELDALLAQSDFVSVHLPLTKETRQSISTDFFKKCKKGAWFINTSRGPIVDTDALVENLYNGQLSGVGIDVLENENFDHLSEKQREIYQRLFAHPSSIITPHIAGWTQESLVKIAEYLLFKIRNYYEM